MNCVDVSELNGRKFVIRKKFVYILVAVAFDMTAMLNLLQLSHFASYAEHRWLLCGSVA